MKITAYIIAYNEEEKIADCIGSVLWADEVIVADSFSEDRTAEIAESLGAKVVQIEFNGFGALRNEAIKHCSHEWIYSLDSDERCTPEVRDEILELIQDAPLDIYRQPRRNYFMGRWIRFSGWYPNYRQPQLFRNGKMTYDLKPVHEGFVSHSDKPIGALKCAIWQFPFKDLDEVLHKANRYSRLGVAKLEERGKKGSLGKAFAHGFWAFFKHYFLKLGFLDGGAGFVIAAAYFDQSFYRYAKLTEVQSHGWPPPEAKPVLRKDAGADV
ncbi:SPBc2 prophage-derived glycosyltransferase SunS [Pontiella desulfatans]|uniref:SPBc2 prophage-derived glycosyltransferase SunS n=1 Tax=Pontiella desulfatans TaxID=2750659 RepID=A0A6C2U692_PONDE|nr:glycosyltransferase family 2 protein [Pontiella desulfatans]VGO15598.1 SPBc2 prophage-derived glycosyltransferase SunS [Pontiella desulfatans]